MLTLSFCAFALFGVVLVLVGASHEGMSKGLGLGLDQMALLGASLSIGIGAGVLIAGPLVDRLPRRPIFTAAGSIAAVGLLGVTAEMSFARAVAHVIAMGFGCGVCETLINTIAVERFGERAVRPLAILHSAATLGAVAAPPIIGLLMTSADWTLPFRATGAGWALVAAATLFVPLGGAPEAVRDRGKALLAPSLLALSVVAFGYVGLETGITLFAVPYAKLGLDLDADRGRAAISSFWFGLLLGRMLLVALSARAEPRLLVGAGLAATLTIAGGVATGWTQVELMVGVCGLSTGLVFPLMVTLAGEWFPESRGTATGIVIGTGCLGGFAIPWLTGVVAEAASVTIAVGSFAFWGLCIAAAAQLAQQLRPRLSTAASEVASSQS